MCACFVCGCVFVSKNPALLQPADHRQKQSESTMGGGGFRAPSPVHAFDFGRVFRLFVFVIVFRADMLRTGLSSVTYSNSL